MVCRVGRPRPVGDTGKACMTRETKLYLYRAGLPVDRRPLATSLVHRNQPDTRHPRREPLTSLPWAALNITGVQRPRSATWTRTGQYYRVTPHAGRPAGSTRAYFVDNCVAAIPDMAARGLGVERGSRLGWYVARTARGWEIHVRRAGPGWNTVQGARTGGPRGGSRGGSHKGTGGISRRHLAEGNVIGFTRRGTFYPKIPVPRAFLDILGAAEDGHVRWARTGGYYNVMPCNPGDDGATRMCSKMYEGRAGRFRSCFNMYIPGEARNRFRRGSRIRWYVAADGRGRWEVHVRPAIS